MVNGTPSTPASDVNSPTGSTSGAGKSSTKGSANVVNKGNDGVRKQSGSLGDGGQR